MKAVWHLLQKNCHRYKVMQKNQVCLTGCEIHDGSVAPSGWNPGTSLDRKSPLGGHRIANASFMGKWKKNKQTNKQKKKTRVSLQRS